ncbi:MAG: hypothetical protein J3K34DRAFT_69742 [Monoraphidium minutum]|nr:MAG: hypothetical protein J3K34DRAFT_69742 [Monoraphidium minutum]
MHPPRRRRVEVVVTGFGSFAFVPSNPTSRIVGWLQEQYGVGAAGSASGSEGSCGDGDGACGGAPPPRRLRHGRIHSCTVLKVSARAVNAYLTRQLEELKRRSADACADACGACAAGACCGPPVVLLLHFGVDVHRPWFNLETRAINNATFRSPDEDGWHPNACPITTVPGMPLDCALSTDLDLSRLHRHLRGRGHDVQLSADAGRFVCNWTYYNSLALCREAMAVAAMATAAAPSACSSGGSGATTSSSSSTCGGGSGAGSAASCTPPRPPPPPRSPPPAASRCTHSLCTCPRLSPSPRPSSSALPSTSSRRSATCCTTRTGAAAGGAASRHRRST